MEVECARSLSRYLRCFDEPSPNPLAPSEENWPRYFMEFAQCHSAFFWPSLTFEELIDGEHNRLARIIVDEFESTDSVAK